MYPWSKGGFTTITNGAGLCAKCNRSKSNWTPTRLYVGGFNAVARRYYPTDVDTTVLWVQGEANDNR